MKWFSKKKKEISMADIELVLPTQGQKFQYIKGDRFDEVVDVESYTSPWVNFTDGSRITFELLNEYLVEMGSDMELLDPLPKKITMPTLGINQNFENNQVKSLISPQFVIQKPVDNPILLLLEKQTSEKLILSIDVSTEMPSKELVSILVSSFNNEDVPSIIENFIYSKIDAEDFKIKLVEQIKKHYKFNEKI